MVGPRPSSVWATRRPSTSTWRSSGSLASARSMRSTLRRARARRNRDVSSLALLGGAGGAGSLGGVRQPHGEAGALAGPAVELDGPAVVGDQVEDGRQPEAAAAALGGEERLEDAVAVLA